MKNLVFHTFAVALSLSLAACGEKSDDTEGPATESTGATMQTTGATTQTTGATESASGATTGASESASATDSTSSATEPTTGAPASCAEATDEAGCKAVAPDELGPCLWVPIFSLTGEAGACAFEPAGGQCLAAMPGDTDCNSYSASCGVNAFYGAGAADQPVIARIEQVCSYYFTAGLELAFCQDPPDPMTDPAAALACNCACAENYPAGA